MYTTPMDSRPGTTPPSRPRTSAAKTGQYNRPTSSSIRSPASSRSTSTASSRSSSTTSRSTSTASSRSSSSSTPSRPPSQASSRSQSPAARIGWMEALRIWNRGHNQWCIPRKGSSEYEQVEKIRRNSKTQTTSVFHSQSLNKDDMDKFRMLRF